MVTQAQLKKISKSKTQKAALLAGLVVALADYAPHVQAHQLAQVMHESGGLVFDREVWGPTPAQQKYEGRRDLGNTQKGDGSKFRGYGPLQVTGRANVAAFRGWCESNGLNPPDFVDKPELIATAPWAGWSVVWYWEVGNPTRKSLTVYADENNIEMITRRVNGGLNGYDDRLSYYDRAALTLLGYPLAGRYIENFQQDNGLKADNVSGPQTRAVMHRKLVAMTPGAADREEVKASPIVETVVETNTVTKTEAVAVTSPSVDAPWWKSKETWTPLLGSSGGAVVGGISGMPWQNLALLVFAGIGITVILLLLKRKDQKIVQAQVAAVNAQPTVTTTE